MASIFTWDDAPSQPISPWETPPSSASPALRQGSPTGRTQSPHKAASPMSDGRHALISENDFGPTEYKLTLSGGARSRERFEQLTTQMLWRLQQSSSYHGSVSTTSAASPQSIAALLQDSQGALYEIGVADDGTFVGISESEMNESLDCLRAMAGRLGCGVEILRRVPISRRAEDDAIPVEHHEQLWVVEASVKPLLSSPTTAEDTAQLVESHACIEQLRVSLTGATTSGKSTLLGTLASGAPDNGRGKSRLSLLRHRHEVVSGITSSLAQEIIGYRIDENGRPSEIVNYALENQASWGDICATVSSTGGRILLGIDTAGAPRFRRTTFRSLIACAPHYAVVVISANSGDECDRSSECGGSLELSLAHLELVLRIRLPLLVIISKLDLASTRIRTVYSKVLSRLKGAGRYPKACPPSNASIPPFTAWNDTEEITAKDIANAMRNNPKTVPIIMTSSVRGDGISLLHAIFAHLPIPGVPVSNLTPTKRRSKVFHIEDVFELQQSFLARCTSSIAGQSSWGVVVSGHLQRGTIKIRDELVVGPFWSPDLTESCSGSDTGSSFPKHRTLTRLMKAREPEWIRFRVVSIRYLRMPVSTLDETNVGSIGLVPVSKVPHTSYLHPEPARDITNERDSIVSRLRKGMVLLSNEIDEPPKAYLIITAHLEVGTGDTVKTLSTGKQVMVYTASVRAAAEVVSSTAPDEDSDASETSFTVDLQFISRREWVEPGQSVFVLIADGHESEMSAFNGFNGVIADTR